MTRQTNRILISGLLYFALTACAGNHAKDFVVILEAENSDENLLVDAERIETYVDIDVVELYEPLHENLWDRIRSGFVLEDPDNARIDAQLSWFANHQDYLDRVTDRASPYLHFIVEQVEERGIPLEIALLPIVESAFDPFAYSHGRAAGLWQFVPGTGRRFGLKQNWWYDGRRDVRESTRAALDYLSYLHNEFGDWLLAVAAYNSGEGKVARAIRNNRALNRPEDFWHLRLPVETSAYVPKLLALRRLVENPGKYCVSWKPLANQPRLARVALNGQTDLAVAAELAEIDVETIFRLNPGFNRWATDPDGPHELFIPLEKYETFVANLSALPEGPQVNWQRHLIRSGESLGSIANRYKTTVALLQDVNGVRSHIIRAGSYLMVPVSTRRLNNYVLTENARISARQNIPRSGNKVNYTVRPGDSFWALARRYNVGIRALAAWNGMAPADPLRTGQKLVIWTHVVNPSAKLTAAIPANTTRSITYTVRRGDSLSAIASRFGVRVGDLLRWNRISTEKYLQPGQRLRLYVDVTRLND